MTPEKVEQLVQERRKLRIFIADINDSVVYVGINKILNQCDHNVYKRNYFDHGACGAFSLYCVKKQVPELETKIRDAILGDAHEMIKAIDEELNQVKGLTV